MIERIAIYIKTSLSETQFPKILAVNSTDACQGLVDVMQWEQYNRKNPLPCYYKVSIFIIFVCLSVVPPTAYNLYAIIMYCDGVYLNALPICVLCMSLAVNLMIGSLMAFRIIRDDYYGAGVGPPTAGPSDYPKGVMRRFSISFWGGDGTLLKC